MMTDSRVDVLPENAIALMRLYVIRRQEEQYLGDLLRKAVGGLYKDMTAPYYSAVCKDLEDSKRTVKSNRSAATIANDVLNRMRKKSKKGGR